MYEEDDTTNEITDDSTARDVPAVVIDRVMKTYATREGVKTVLDEVSLTVEHGEFVSIVGPSGCGKSTLLGMITGLHPASGGTITVRGEQVTDLVKDIGFAFQRDALLPWRTALRNVALPLRIRGMKKKQAETVALEWLARVGLEKHSNKYPHQLSGGMRKRVAIAVMLAYKPPILLLDEPFSALDVQTRSLMENDLLGLCQKLGQTVILITHDLEEAIAMSDRVFVMSAMPGRVIGEYPITLPKPRNVLEVKADPAFSALYSRLWDDLRDEVLRAGDMELEHA